MDCGKLYMAIYIYLYENHKPKTEAKYFLNYKMKLTNSEYIMFLQNLFQFTYISIGIYFF